MQDNLGTSYYNEPLVEETKLQQMVSNDISFDKREEYLRRFLLVFVDGYNKILRVLMVKHHIKLKEESKPITQKL